MNIGERIRRLREDQEMTQTELAQQIGSTKQTIYKYENGIVTNIPYDKLVLLAKALETTPAALMGWETSVSNVGTNIKKRREELGLTQEELAKKLGYKSKSTINKIEMGMNDISQSKIIAFAKVLNTTAAYLMGWDGRILSLEEYNEKVLKQAWKNFIRMIESVGYEITELENDRYEIVSEKYGSAIIVTKKQLSSLDTTIMNYISYTADKFFEEHSNSTEN